VQRPKLGTERVFQHGRVCGGDQAGALLADHRPEIRVDRLRRATVAPWRNPAWCSTAIPRTRCCCAVRKPRRSKSAATTTVAPSCIRSPRRTRNQRRDRTVWRTRLDPCTRPNDTPWGRTAKQAAPPTSRPCGSPHSQRRGSLKLPGSTCTRCRSCSRRRPDSARRNAIDRRPPDSQSRSRAQRSPV